MTTTEEEYLTLIKETASRLSLSVSNEHFDENKEYYWNNRGQLKTVIEKKIPDDKLKIIFMVHINKLGLCSDALEEEQTLKYPPVRIIPTKLYSVYSW